MLKETALYSDETLNSKEGHMLRLLSCDDEIWNAYIATLSATRKLAEVTEPQYRNYRDETSDYVPHLQARHAVDELQGLVDIEAGKLLNASVPMWLEVAYFVYSRKDEYTYCRDTGHRLIRWSWKRYRRELEAARKAAAGLIKAILEHMAKAQNQGIDVDGRWAKLHAEIIEATEDMARLYKQNRTVADAMLKILNEGMEWCLEEREYGRVAAISEDLSELMWDAVRDGIDDGDIGLMEIKVETISENLEILNTRPVPNLSPWQLQLLGEVTRAAI